MRMIITPCSPTTEQWGAPRAPPWTWDTLSLETAAIPIFQRIVIRPFKFRIFLWLAPPWACLNTTPIRTTLLAKLLPIHPATISIETHPWRFLISTPVNVCSESLPVIGHSSGEACSLGGAIEERDPFDPQLDEWFGKACRRDDTKHSKSIPWRRFEGDSGYEFKGYLAALCSHPLDLYKVIHLPYDTHTKKNLGYAFIRFFTPKALSNTMIAVWELLERRSWF